MFRPHYQIHTYAGNGTHFEEKDVLDSVKIFLDRHNIPSEIVSNVNFFGNSIYVKLKKGSAKKYGNDMNSAFKTLSTSSFSYSLNEMDDRISCWVPFLEDIVEANKKHEFELWRQNNHFHTPK